MAEIEYLVSFGTYLYGENRAEAEDAVSARRRASPSAGAHGGFALASLAEPRRLVGRGELAPEGDTEAFRDAVAIFRNAHFPGPAKKLYFEEDRYLWAQAEVISNLKHESPLTVMPWEVSFIADDPFYYSDTEDTETLASGGGTVVVGGLAFATPVWSLTVSTATGTITLTNTTTAQTMTLTPTATGLYTLYTDGDNEEQRVVGPSGAVYEGWDGIIPLLVPGSNTITIGLAGGAALSARTVRWRDRWG